MLQGQLQVNPFDIKDSAGKGPDFLYNTDKRTVAMWLVPGRCLSMHGQDLTYDGSLPKYQVITREIYEKHQG